MTSPPTRRAMLRATAIIAAVPVGFAFGNLAPNDRALILCARRDALYRRMDRLAIIEDRQMTAERAAGLPPDPVHAARLRAAWTRLEDAVATVEAGIIATPATTLQGVTAKLRATGAETLGDHSMFGAFAAPAILSALADLDRIGGAQ